LRKWGFNGIKIARGDGEENGIKKGWGQYAVKMTS